MRNKGPTKLQPKPCLCGCQELVKVHKYFRASGAGFWYSVNDFIKGHHKRGLGGFNQEIHSSRICLCGCGLYTNKFRGKFNKFIKGHENIGRIAWNKNKSFSESTRAKMSLARMGKEPANKVNLDVDKLKQIYIKDKKTISQASEILNISKDVIKNRLRSLGLSRTTKESCSLPEFKDRMRRIRVQVLSSKPFVDFPNKLEKLVYDSLDESGVYYQKQVPLFNKFVVDALFPECKLVLEVFGRYWHENLKTKKKDLSKKKYLNKCGYKVEEIWDYEIKQKGVDYILQKVLNRHNLI